MLTKLKTLPLRLLMATSLLFLVFLLGAPVSDVYATCECEHSFCLSPPSPYACDPSGNDPNPVFYEEHNCGSQGSCTTDDICVRPECYGTGCGTWIGNCGSPGCTTFCPSTQPPQSQCIGTCGSPPPPPPSCVDEAPEAPINPAPANGSSVVSYSIPFSWSHSDFGENCSGGTNEYELWIDGAYVATISEGTTNYLHTFPTTSYGTHTWSVVANNGNESATGGPWSFTINRHARLTGWIWEDYDGAGDVDVSDLWSHSSISCPADHNSNNFTLTQGGNNAILGWACNTPQGGSNNPYLYTNYYTLNNGSGQGTYTFVFGGLPTGDTYNCADVSWTYQRCTAQSGGTCTATSTQTGTGCTASNLVLGDVNGINFSNWFWWKIDQRSRINGIVWEDLNLNTAADQPAELWSHPSIACPAPRTSANISMTGATITGWQCTPNANYYTNALPLGTNGQGTVSLTLNNRVDNVLYPCANVSWTFLRCLNSTCAGPGNVVTTTGTGCTANNLTIGEGNGPYFTNHMYWKLVPDPPAAPTACLYPPAPISDLQGTHQLVVGGYTINVFPTTVPQNFGGQALDGDSNLANGGIYRRPFNPVTGLESDPPSTISSFSCSGGTCNFPFSSTSIAAGFSTYYPTITDATALSCTGRENIPVGYSDCDLATSPPSPDCDVSYTQGDTKPLCSTALWPTQYSGPNQLVTFPTNAADADGNTVRYDFDSTCGSFKNVAEIKVLAQGECSGGCPQMAMTLTDTAGNRHHRTGVPVSVNGDYSWIPTPPIALPITMVEVRYTNDAGVAGRNLRVYNVRLYDTVGGSPYITFEPEQATNPQLKVFYDIGTSQYDGATVYSYDNDGAEDFFRPASGYVWMAYDGALRLPMVWQTPATATACDLTITPLVTLPNFNGDACTQTLAPTTRSVTGSVYETNGGACGMPGAGVITGNNTGIQLKNGAVNIDPVGTFAGGNEVYSIAPVWASTIFDSICVTNPGGLGGGTAAYFINCLESSQISCSGTDGLGCAIGCTPTNYLQSGNIVANIGFDVIDNEKWFTFIDGDFFGDSVIGDVSETPQGAFTSNFINRQTGASAGGFGFADDIIDPKRAGSGVSEFGGYGQQLGAVANGSSYFDFTDKWLSNYSFNPPTHAEVKTSHEGITGGTNVRFNAGAVYKFDLAGFNAWYNAVNTYTILGASGSGVAIVYVNDDSGGTITLDHRLVTFNNNAYTNRLILVTDLPIVVDADFGIPDAELASYNVTATRTTLTGVFDLIIVSSQSVTLESKYDWAGGVLDLPLLFDGMLISKTSVNLDRDLGYANNELYPGTTVRYYPRALYRVAEIESNNSDINNYTGLTTFDLQWEYDQ